MAYKRLTEDDKWNYKHRPLDELYIIYPDETKNYIRSTKKYWTNKENYMPERSEPYENPEAEREAVKRRRATVPPKLGKTTLETTTIVVPVEHKHYHEQLQKALNEEGHISKARFSDYQMGMKNADGEFESHDLRASKFEVKFENQLEELIRNIKIPEVRNVRPRKKEILKQPGEAKRDFLCGDLHFQYLRMEDGEMIPCHDEQVIDIIHQVTKERQPDRIIFGGDVFDFPQFSRWEQLSIFLDTLNPTIRRVAEFLDHLREDCPNTKIVWVPGNHDRRPQKLRTRSPQIEELLKAKVDGVGLPVFSIQNLLQLEARGIEYIDHVNARFQINDRLGVEHKGNNKQSLGRKLISTIGFDGHSTNEPRPEVLETPIGIRTITHYMLPMAGRTDGPIPSYASGYSASGQPDLMDMNWVQGYGWATYLDGDQPFQVQKVIINRHDGYKTFDGNKVYEPRNL